jgi:hypothetical protein
MNMRGHVDVSVDSDNNAINGRTFIFKQGPARKKPFEQDFVCPPSVLNEFAGIITGLHDNPAVRVALSYKSI